MTAAGDLPSILQTKLFRVPLSEDHVHRPHLLERLQQVKQIPSDRCQCPCRLWKIRPFELVGPSSATVTVPGCRLMRNDNDPGFI